MNKAQCLFCLTAEKAFHSRFGTLFPRGPQQRDFRTKTSISRSISSEERNNLQYSAFPDFHDTIIIKV